MSDLSASRKIKSLITSDGTLYYVSSSMFHERSCEKITITEKSGDMGYILWYQLWKDGEVAREINSLHVSVVEYFPTTIDDLPF